MKLIPTGVTRSIAMTVLKTKKNSPHIFFVGGVIGMVGTTVLACRATLKLDKSLDEIKNDLHTVKELSPNNSNNEHLEPYTEHEYYRDLGHVYLKSAVRLGKLYGPSVLLGVASIGALSGSHIQLTRRNTALTATLAAVSKAYDDYRARMQEEIGEDREYDIYHGIEEVKGEDGKKVKVVNTSRYSMYSKVFDETCENWFPDPERNRFLIMQQQKYFNYRLQSRGHVMLNEVYDALGFNPTTAGCVVGWLRDGDGDGFIDFGLFDGEMAARFINGLQGSIILDFNVDGIVYQMLGDRT